MNLGIILIILGIFMIPAGIRSCGLKEYLTPKELRQSGGMAALGGICLGVGISMLFFS